MNKGYALENSTIVLNRDLTELDFFVKEFIEVLKRQRIKLCPQPTKRLNTKRQPNARSQGIHK